MGILALFKPTPKPDLGDQVIGGGKKGAGPNMTEKFGVRSLVAEGMILDGNLSGRDGAAVDGVVNGNITVTGEHRAVLIRHRAVVNGVVRAAVVVVSGEVNGDIYAKSVRMYPGALVNGRVIADRLIMDDGARINNELMAVGAKPGPATIDAVAVSVAEEVLPGSPVIRHPMVAPHIVKSA